MLTGSDLYDSLAETNSKFSKSCQKEYDTINELCGKQFKRIAKEEGKHDEALESLDAKLRKANFQYDKQRVKSSASGSANAYGASGAASATHEQFVPVLSQLTEDITKAKLTHGVNMAGKRDAMVREVARTLGNLSELEFRRACDNVRRAGGEIGPVMGAQALLGDKPDKGDASQMPRDWPEPLQDANEHLQAPAYLGAPSSPGSQSMPNGHFIESLRPPRMNGERFDSVASRGSSRRGSVTFAPTTETISRQNSPRLPPQQLSPQQQQMNSSPRQIQRTVTDNEATVVQRQSARPPLDTSFRSYSQQTRSSPQEESPSFRDSPIAKVPAVQTPSVLQHAISQRGNVGYVDAKRVDPISEEQKGFADTPYETMRKIPPGFELDETEMSPDKPLRTMQESQAAAAPTHATRLDYGEKEAEADQKPTSTDLHRSASMESTASQQSFVARMKTKYAEEKKEAKFASSPPSSGGVQPRRPLPHAGPSHSATSSASSGSSGARVSSIAQRYEQNTSNSSGFMSPPSSRNTSASFMSNSKPSDFDTARPQHKQRASLPVVPAAIADTARPNHEHRHPSFCGCEECARLGYNTQRAGQVASTSMGGKAANRPWEDDAGTMRSSRSDRRVSMPVGYGAR